MIDEIVRKLTIELQETVTTERQVVYILVQMRKLMDRRSEKPDSPAYTTLRLYCNWVAHIGLSNSEAKAIVAKANEIYPRLIAQTLTPGDKSALLETYTFTALRADINRFAADNSLPAFSDTNWNWFVALLLPVLQDCPLTAKSSWAQPLEIDEVVLRSEPVNATNQPDGHPPRIVWGFISKGQDRYWVTANGGTSTTTESTTV